MECLIWYERDGCEQNKCGENRMIDKKNDEIYGQRMKMASRG